MPVNFIIGDSLGVGLAPYLPGFAAHVVGSTTVAFWLGQDLSFIGPGDLVLVSLGTNAEGDFAGSAVTLVATLQGQGARVVWLSPPPMPARIGDRSAVHAAINSLGVAVIEAPAGLERASDGIHCTGRGYQQWAQAILAQLPALSIDLQAFTADHPLVTVTADGSSWSPDVSTTPLVIGIVVIALAVALLVRRN